VAGMLDMDIGEELRVQSSMKLVLMDRFSNRLRDAALGDEVKGYYRKECNGQPWVQPRGRDKAAWPLRERIGQK
jgi:hypothetical protein